jgi:hypothetical protein
MPVRGFRGILVLGCVFAAAGGSAQDWATAMFETTGHNFGAVACGGKVEYEFVLTNKYAVDIHISDVRASCSCTTPRIEKALLKPYEKGAIIAHLNTDSYLGPRRATITVTIDQPSPAQVQLEVAAYVHKEVLFDPDSIALGSVDQGAGAEGKIIVYRAGRIDWAVSEAKAGNPHLTCRVIERARQDNQVWYELRVRLDKSTPCGSFKDQVILSTNDADAPQIPVTVEGEVVAKVNVSPASLFLGTLQPGEKATRKVVVWSKEPFRITSVAGDPASFQLAAPEKQPAKKVYVLPVTFVAGSDRGRVVKTIHITTDREGAAAEVSTYAIVTP